MENNQPVLPRILDFAQSLILQTLKSGEMAIDATLGNGHDAHFLYRTVGETGFLWGFDVQARAVSRSTEKIQGSFPEARNYLFFLESHAKMLEKLGEAYKGKVGAIMFNLGYLPGSDKTIITLAEPTLKALEQAILLLRRGGILTVVVYPGHHGGEIESQAVTYFLSGLPAEKGEVIRYQFLNKQKKPPYLLAFVKS